MGGVDHVVRLEDLLALAAFGLAQGSFGGVEVVSAFPDGHLNAFGVEVLQDGLVAAELGGRVAFVVGNDVRLMNLVHSNFCHHGRRSLGGRFSPCDWTHG